jgi:hypothetical protein
MDTMIIGREGISNPTRNQLDFPSLSMHGELLSGILGKYAALTEKGYVFAAVVGTAASVPVVSALTNAPALWNPASSGKWVYPLRVICSVGAIGTAVLQGFTLSYLINAGSAVATGGVVATWTNQAPVNCLLGKGTAASTLFAPAVSTYTVNPAWLMDLGFGHFAQGTAATGHLVSQFYYDFDGTLVMPPGTVVNFGSTIASSTTYTTTFIFAELPAPIASIT